ncbi:hypothetical protein BEP19_02190 [Ammoniphilus oxalaticus]|uniref:Metallo-beta-lactamase domain-containing protein n=1 Tax=Ammoniphilus oxalaticus TaxID=66863 RepID=A0A419SND9_9BACL|nr:MBL fold metallo-hydrolase [Ammoniphilus oxalaticus]RKD25773.1 hypothetical protein BEP19_02190 [Ammoniphilus oxalaticus]
MTKPTLVTVDELKIMIVMDNTIDVFMAGAEHAQRFDCATLHTAVGLSPLIAEHGFCATIQVKKGEQTQTVLLDTGVSPNGVLHNMRTLGIELGEMQAIALSHGHADHTLGLPGLIDRFGESRAIPLVAHPDAFLERKVIFPDGREMCFSPPLELNQLDPNKIEVRKETGPTTLVDQAVLVTGQIPRQTSFENGFPFHYTKREGVWENDPLILDDQALVVHVEGKGLVIITGCGHAGIINTIRYAQELTGVEKIHAVIGGFHLTGGFFEKIIPDTITEFKKIKPDYLVPGHCTGWYAIQQIAQHLPDAFIPNNVGTLLRFSAE